MYIPLSQDDMSDYIDYINSTLRELNIGEKVSPVHQQVRLVLQIQIKLEAQYWDEGKFDVELIQSTSTKLSPLLTF